jgi:hypothetical protein
MSTYRLFYTTELRWQVPVADVLARIQAHWREHHAAEGYPWCLVTGYPSDAPGIKRIAFHLRDVFDSLHQHALVGLLRAAIGADAVALVDGRVGVWTHVDTCRAVTMEELAQPPWDHRGKPIASIMVSDVIFPQNWTWTLPLAPGANHNDTPDIALETVLRRTLTSGTHEMEILEIDMRRTLVEDMQEEFGIKPLPPDDAFVVMMRCRLCRIADADVVALPCRCVCLCLACYKQEYSAPQHAAFAHVCPGCYATNVTQFIALDDLDSM